MAYGRELEKRYNKNFRFTITTNGVLLDEEKDGVYQPGNVNVVLSIDGRQGGQRPDASPSTAAAATM